MAANPIKIYADKLVAQAKADPKKATILAVLTVIMIFSWYRMSSGDSAHRMRKTAVGAKTLWIRKTIMRTREHPETMSIWRIVEVKCEWASEALSAVCHSSK